MQRLVRLIRVVVQSSGVETPVRGFRGAAPGRATLAWGSFRAEDSQTQADSAGACLLPP